MLVIFTDLPILVHKFEMNFCTVPLALSTLIEEWLVCHKQNKQTNRQASKICKTINSHLYNIFGVSAQASLVTLAKTYVHLLLKK